MKYLFQNARIVMLTGIYDGEVLVEDSTISQVRIGGKIIDETAQVIDVAGRYLAPGFIDIHTHGAGGYDFMDGDIDSIYNACKEHMKYGTTTILPTTLTSTEDSLIKYIELFNKVEKEKEGYPYIHGLHLEGPYFSVNRRGAQKLESLRNPSKEEYEEIISKTDMIKRWSFAVELPGAKEFLLYLQDHQIISSLAHSDADCRDVFEAYENGLSCLTHFYSCMTTVERKNAYRIAGAIEAGYLIDDLYVEVIADGCHLPAELLELIYKIKGADRICLVTDSMRAAGMPDGEYILGNLSEGMKCIKEDGVAKLLDRSAFAGSVATSDLLVKTFKELTTAPLFEVIKMVSHTPAKMLGIEKTKGSISEKKDADLVLFDNDINISLVMIRGKIVKNID